MAKLNHYLVTSSLIIFFCFSTAFLHAESQDTATSTHKEVKLNISEIEDTTLEQDITIEQTQLGSFVVDSYSPEEKKPDSATKGKSILNTNAIKSSVHLKDSLKVPKTPSEAQKLGWKSKTISIPQPVSNLVKEVPEEVKAKKARLKKKMEYIRAQEAKSMPSKQR